MKLFFVSFKPALIAALLMTVLMGGVYPLFIFGIGQLFFKNQADGTLYYYENQEVIGSAWIGQNFTQSQYFHPRPSAAGNGYDPTSSSGSNLGPTSQKLIDALTQRAASYRSENSLASDAIIPADAVTSSASGLDPHIGVTNAELQAARIAKARGWPVDAVNQVIKEYTEGRTFGLFGEKRINVLRINLALDKISTDGSLCKNGS